MLRIIRWLRGYVVFELFGRFPERFLNLCTRQGRFLFNAEPRKDGFCGSMLLSDYFRIRPLAHRAGVRLRVKERHGLPFLLGKYRRRKGLVFGAIAFILIIVFMQGFVWTVEINGVKTFSTVEFSQMLREEGLYEGAFRLNLDLHAIERQIMQREDGISWMSINIIGTKAEVEVKEAEQRPEGIAADIPCNITASKDGVILSMNTKQGTAQIPVGSAVIEGQLIVSGVVENPSGKVSFVHSDAEVMAEMSQTRTFTVSKAGEYKRPVGVTSRLRLDFLWLSVPVSASPVTGEYTSRIIKEQLFLNNTAVSCGVSREHCTSYVYSDFTYTEAAAKEVLSAQDALYRLFALQNCETVNASSSFIGTEDSFSLRVTYSCTEDIAAEENFIVN